MRMSLRVQGTTEEELEMLREQLRMSVRFNESLRMS
jgi:hypothetical protein